MSTNECYLTKLNRSLSLKESSNGLYLIDMKELCIESSVCHHAGHFSVQKEPRNLVFPPPGLEPIRSSSHADTTGDHGSDSYHSGSCDGVSQVPVRDPHELGGDTHHRPRPGDSNGCGQQDQHAASRGAVPERSNRRDCKSFATPKFRNYDKGITTSGSRCSDANGNVGGRGRVGAGIFGSHSRRIIGTGWSPISCGDVPESTSTSPTCAKSGDAGNCAKAFIFIKGVFIFIKGLCFWCFLGFLGILVHCVAHLSCISPKHIADSIDCNVVRHVRIIAYNV